MMRAILTAVRPFNGDEGLLWLFTSAGPICGGAMLLALVAALVLCLMGTVKRNPSSAQIALTVALLPLVVSILGALVGLSIAWREGLLTSEPLACSLDLAKLCLAGLIVSSLPLAWALALVRVRPQ